MAAPTMVAGHTTQTDVANNTSRTINVPTHASGDHIFIAVTHDAIDAGVASTGFTALYDNVSIAGAASFTLLVKKAGGSEGSTYTITSTVSERVVAIAWAVNGAGGIDAYGTNASGTSTTATVPAVTTTRVDTLRISIVATDSSATTTPIGTASGHTEIAELFGTSAGGLSVQHKTLASAGTDASQTASLNASDQWLGVTFAIASVVEVRNTKAVVYLELGGAAVRVTKAGVYLELIPDTVIEQAVAGTLTSSGALVRSTNKLVAGTLTTAGAIVKAISKFFAGVLDSSGLPIFGRTTLLSMAGTLTSSGALVRRVGKALAGALTTAGALVREYLAKPTPGPPWTLPTRSRALTLMNRATLTVKERIRTLTLRDSD